MVMLTPILAYSLAKGSEMGFVSIASSLLQQIVGGARAAGTFATQQGLSTSTAITTPRGDEVYVREAGYTSGADTFIVNGRNFGGLKDMATGNESITDKITGANATLNGDKITSGNFANLTAAKAAQNAETLKHDLIKTIQNSHLGQLAQEVSNGYGHAYGLSATDRDTITRSTNQANLKAWAETEGVDLSKATIDAKTGKASFGFNTPKWCPVKAGVGGELSITSQDMDTYKEGLSKEDRESFERSYNTALSNEIASNFNNTAAWQNLTKKLDSHSSALIQNSADNYTNAKTLSDAISTNNAASLITNYINKELGGVVNRENVAVALSTLDQMGADGRSSEAAKYAGVSTDLSHNLKEQKKVGYLDPVNDPAKAEFKTHLRGQTLQKDGDEHNAAVDNRNAPLPQDNTGVQSRVEQGVRNGKIKHTPHLSDVDVPKSTSSNYEREKFLQSFRDKGYSE